MRWEDDGIYLTGRPHGETSVIANVFTREHGRTSGLVKGGRSRRLRPLLQSGNSLKVDWRARLDEQLGVYTVELAEATAAKVLDNRLALCGISAICALLQVLPERDPHPALFAAAQATLKECGAAEVRVDLAVRMVGFELSILDELGFGLNLRACAVTGQEAGLAYVSPRSGQAVASAAGAPYRDKLLPLPSFLTNAANTGAISQSDIADGFELTGYFLREHVFAEAGGVIPKACEDFRTFSSRVRRGEDAAAK